MSIRKIKTVYIFIIMFFLPSILLVAQEDKTGVKKQTHEIDYDVIFLDTITIENPIFIKYEGEYKIEKESTVTGKCIRVNKEIKYYNYFITSKRYFEEICQKYNDDLLRIYLDENCYSLEYGLPAYHDALEQHSKIDIKGILHGFHYPVGDNQYKWYVFNPECKQKCNDKIYYSEEFPTNKFAIFLKRGYRISLFEENELKNNYYIKVAVPIVGHSPDWKMDVKIDTSYPTLSKQELLDKYIDAKKGLENKYISHFPENVIIDSTYKLTVFGDIDYRMILETKIIDNKTINKLIDKAKAVYDAGDTCLIVINRFNDKDFYLDSISSLDSLKIDMPCYKNKFPVPNFNDMISFDENNEYNLSSSFKLHVLDAKPGIYFSPKNMFEANKYMPKYWEHGYSKGVAVDKTKDIAIYWFVMW